MNATHAARDCPSPSRSPRRAVLPAMRPTLALALGLLLAGLVSAGAAEAPLDYNEAIRPILS